MKLGKAFSDGVVSESKISRGDDRDSKPSWWMGVGRILFLTCLFLVCMFILLTRLFYLTLIDGHRYRVLSDTNRIRELVRHAPRGILLDRTGKALAANIPRYRMEELCSTAETQVCTRTLPKEEGDRLIAQGLPAGSFLEVDYERDYPYGSNLSHVIGYTGELDEEELRDGYYVARNYKRGDRIGRVGAEAVYEEKLRGRDGRELVEIDASGKILRTLGIDQEVPGEDVTLSIDAELNSAAGSAFPSGKKGAIVVAKPLTGEILALYSSPTFSPERFSQGLRADEYIDLVENPDQPLFDRAIGGVYPPGSTFKLVTALAALEEKAVDEHTLVQDIGVIRIGSKFSFPNWYFLKYGKTDGNVDIVKGLQRSNDIYFYKAGEFLGISKLAKWAHTVGIGKPLGIEIGGEASGLMPDPAWKNDRFASPADLEARNNAWYLGDTYHIAIGQGYLLVSPLQVNAWTNIIANQGKICRPTIKKREAGSLPAQAGGKREECEDIGVQQDTIRLITEGMRRACEPGGTGWPLFNFRVKREASSVKQESTPSENVTPDALHIPVACKTGTAEFGDPNDRTHAWFTAFSPVPPFAEATEGQAPSSESEDVLLGEPEISVTVLVEEAGEGSDIAAPVAKKIFEEWFSR